MHERQRPKRALSRTSILKSVVIDSQLADQLEIIEKKRFVDKGRYMKAFFSQKNKEKLMIKPKESRGLFNVHTMPIREF